MNLDVLSEILLFRLAELADSTIFTFYYFIGGLCVSWVLDTIMPKFDKTKHAAIIILEILGELAITIFGAFILFKIGNKINVPFARYFSKEEKTQLVSVTESKVRGSIAISFAIFLLQENMKKKILYLFDRGELKDLNLLDFFD